MRCEETWVVLLEPLQRGGCWLSPSLEVEREPRGLNRGDDWSQVQVAAHGGCGERHAHRPQLGSPAASCGGSWPFTVARAQQQRWGPAAGAHISIILNKAHHKSLSGESNLLILSKMRNQSHTQTLSVFQFYLAFLSMLTTFLLLLLLLLSWQSSSYIFNINPWSNIWFAKIFFPIL